MYKNNYRSLILFCEKKYIEVGKIVKIKMDFADADDRIYQCYLLKIFA